MALFADVSIEVVQTAYAVICAVHPSVRNFMLSLPGDPGDALLLPARLVTYSVVHSGFWHFLANLLCLLYFGIPFARKAGVLKTVLLYICGAVAGGAAFLIAAGIGCVPGEMLCGASSAVLAIAAASAVVIPDFRFPAPLADKIPMKWVAIAVMTAVMAGSESIYSAFAHIGGISAGLIFGLACRGFLITKRVEEADGVNAMESQDMTGEAESDIICKLRRSGFSSLTESEKKTVGSISRDKR